MIQGPRGVGWGRNSPRKCPAAIVNYLRALLLHHCPSARVAFRAQALLTSKVSAKSSQPAPPGLTSLSVALSASFLPLQPRPPPTSARPLTLPPYGPAQAAGPPLPHVCFCLSSDVCHVSEPPAVLSGRELRSL
ncbi:hypothetical protein NDU88_006338 [Pleurodeles waltl]|uniref:Uncharacterized protein n=1 Tax=Pleurodeles waltl TaxID=8319 RepID=A0AAV7WEE0_PLEWA|nr:hypothetical protein NDU88_006338 [Pleurodeles waltl]